MKHSPYSQFDIKRMNYRDFLAMDRTTLANERTLLSYFRTSMMVLASGITLIKLFSAPEVVMLGYAMLPLSGLIITLGALRYWKIRNAIYVALDRLIEESRTTPPSQPFLQNDNNGNGQLATGNGRKNVGCGERGVTEERQ